ncbi:MAG: hypothetical protein V7K89_07815 [Nostoc sp.]|uniref:hypothetical protein n=1 Tax=Nostoc sp. TaxID=1180 RepID=UPI002FF47E4F
MPKPRNFFHLGLNELENIVKLTIRASSAEMAVKIYELLELSLFCHFPGGRSRLSLMRQSIQAILLEKNGSCICS